MTHLVFLVALALPDGTGNGDQSAPTTAPPQVVWQTSGSLRPSRLRKVLIVPAQTPRPIELMITLTLLDPRSTFAVSSLRDSKPEFCRVSLPPTP